MKPAEDKEYIAYCQQILGKAQKEYKTTLKKISFDHRMYKALIASTSILAIVILLRIYPIDILVTLLPIGGVMLVFLMATIADLHVCKQEKLQYEKNATCAKKIDYYALPYTKWLQKTQKNRAEDSKAVCTAMKSVLNS